MQSPPQAYLFFGIPGSGRREVLFDLIETAATAEATSLFFRPEGEEISAFDEQIATLPHVETVEWRLENERIVHGSVSGSPRTLFFMAPGTANPAEMADAFKRWLDHNQCAVARIVTVLHCAFLKEHPGATPWFDACIHFSDVVLLNRREEVDNRWVRDFEERFRKERYPCRFLMVKNGRVRNPHEVLEPEARRFSLHFDELVPIEEDSLDGDEQPEDMRPDPYLERNESGQRAKPIPDIRKFLGGGGTG